MQPRLAARQSRMFDSSALFLKLSELGRGSPFGEETRTAMNSRSGDIFGRRRQEPPWPATNRLTQEPFTGHWSNRFPTLAQGVCATSQVEPAWCHSCFMGAVLLVGETQATRDPCGAPPCHSINAGGWVTLKTELSATANQSRRSIC